MGLVLRWCRMCIRRTMVRQLPYPHPRLSPLPHALPSYPLLPLLPPPSSRHPPPIHNPTNHPPHRNHHRRNRRSRRPRRHHLPNHRALQPRQLWPRLLDHRRHRRCWERARWLDTADTQGAAGWAVSVVCGRGTWDGRVGKWGERGVIVYVHGKRRKVMMEMEGGVV